MKIFKKDVLRIGILEGASIKVPGADKGSTDGHAQTAAKESRAGQRA